MASAKRHAYGARAVGAATAREARQPRDARHVSAPCHLTRLISARTFRQRGGSGVEMEMGWRWDR
eukprot:2753574-Pyramimonas_sp.AAC.1